jgi:UDP:flavonoid glycosyltransferase YjiC (YdhE family)
VSPLVGSESFPDFRSSFGSIVLDEPQEITSKDSTSSLLWPSFLTYLFLSSFPESVLDAISLAGVRAIVSPGWGGLDKEMIESAGPNVFALGNVPHDWLFERVSAVCHHGGAGKLNFPLPLSAGKAS